MNWNDISIKKYKMIEEASKETDIMKRSIKLLAIVEDKEEKDYYDLPIGDLKMKMSKLLFMAEKPEGKFKDKIVINETTYYLQDRINKWPAIQYIDYMNVVAEEELDIAKVMAIIYMPKGLVYGETYDPIDYYELFLDNISIIDAFSAADFFFNSYQILIKTMVKYSLKKKKRKNKMILKIQWLVNRIKQKFGIH